MKEVFNRVLACDDIQAVKNVVTIMAESCEIGMNDGRTMEMMRQVQGEVDDCHYDDEMAKMHLCLIGNLHGMDVAKDYFHEVKDKKVNIWDWCVLWGEMVRRHGHKIRKWFPNIREMDFERKVFDECIAFLDNGKLPYFDLNV